jgi:hypothetical protein
MHAGYTAVASGECDRAERPTESRPWLNKDTGLVAVAEPSFLPLPAVEVAVFVALDDIGRS